MTIAALAHKGLLDVAPVVPPVDDSEVSLAFALDKGYVECFKVMLASMAKQGALCNSPIVIYSDDETLFDDPIIKLVSDKQVLLKGSKKDTIYSLARDNVKRPEKSDWNRGTFLKWCVFEPQVTRRLLFLDVDMLVLGSLEGLLNSSKDTPLVTCPQFQQSLKEGDVQNQLLDMLRGDFDAKHKRRINSGVMLINEALLTDAFFDEITGYAGQRVAIHEQGHLSDYFGKKSDLFAMAPSKYNYQDSYLRLLKNEGYQEILDQVSVLHYAGGAKPWNDAGSKLAGLASIDIWHEYKKLAHDVLLYR